MRYFIDTEFWEQGSHEPIHLISVGIVSEDGREFYREVFGAQHWVESEWLQENVIPHLVGGEVAVSPFEISSHILQFIGDDPKPEFWGYYSDYDWVVFCQLFGDMGSLPKGWPFYCRDVKQLMDDRGIRHIKQEDDAPHDALADALWAFRAWETVQTYCDGGNSGNSIS